MTAMADPGPVLFFDSGVGGLTVLRAARDILPDHRFHYVVDDAAFPYGDWDESKLRDHIVALMGDLIAARRPAVVVIACNTASTLVLPALRERFDVPFVGTVPAIKPAAERTETGVVAVLSTPGTMRRDYTRELIGSFARECHVRLVGAPDLAGLTEARMRGEPVSDEAVLTQMAPCFIEIGGPAHRHRGARLHAFPVPAGDHGAARAMAGDLAGSGAGHRPPPGHGARGARGLARRREHRELHRQAAAAGDAGAAVGAWPGGGGASRSLTFACLPHR